ncbi:hypothetical protein CNY89_19660 [Amaricoccus sp. HAR-UPW-R2A-40]|nr:hypothetical protein CNY89_19660 [Amaricoccus sp. HAR-UPW-R2A-40]
MTNTHLATPRCKPNSQPLGPREPFRPLPRSLLALAGVIVCIELFLELADRGILSDPSLRSRVYMVGAFWSGLLHGARPIFEGQGWTMFVTHAFLHGGFLHMAMNTAVLLGLGRFTADRYGAWTVLPVFLVSAVAGGLAFGLMSSDPVPMVGASGAVFGAERTMNPACEQTPVTSLTNAIRELSRGQTT